MSGDPSPDEDCSCTTCALKGGENLRRLGDDGYLNNMLENRRLDPKEKKLLQKLAETKGAYEDIRKQLITSRGPSEGNDSQISSALFEMITRIDKGAIHEPNECCSCCYCAALFPKSGRKRKRGAVAKASFTSTGSRTQGTSDRKNYKAKKINSEPEVECRCPFETSSEDEMRQKERKKAKATGTPGPPSESAAVSSTDVKQKSKKSINQRTIDSVTLIKEKIKAKPKSTPSESRPPQRKPPTRKPSKKTSNEPIGFAYSKEVADLIKHKSVKKFQRQLQEWECDPEWCVPEECNPEECYEKVKKRNALRNKAIDKLRKSIQSIADTSVPETQEAVQKKTDQRDKKVNVRGPKRTSSTRTGRREGDLLRKCFCVLKLKSRKKGKQEKDKQITKSENMGQVGKKKSGKTKEQQTRIKEQDKQTMKESESPIKGTAKKPEKTKEPKGSTKDLSTATRRPGKSVSTSGIKIQSKSRATSLNKVKKRGDTSGKSISKINRRRPMEDSNSDQNQRYRRVIRIESSFKINIELSKVPCFPLGDQMRVREPVYSKPKPPVVKQKHSLATLGSQHEIAMRHKKTDAKENDSVICMCRETTTAAQQPDIIVRKQAGTKTRKEKPSKILYNSKTNTQKATMKTTSSMTKALVPYKEKKVQRKEEWREPRPSRPIQERSYPVSRKEPLCMTRVISLSSGLDLTIQFSKCLNDADSANDLPRKSNKNAKKSGQLTHTYTCKPYVSFPGNYNRYEDPTLLRRNKNYQNKLSKGMSGDTRSVNKRSENHELKRCFCTMRLQKAEHHRQTALYAITEMNANPFLYKNKFVKPENVRKSKVKRQPRNVNPPDIVGVCDSNTSKHNSLISGRNLFKKVSSTLTGIGKFMSKCFCTMNVQVPPYKLKPYECEPGFCTPGECDPYVCQKRIKQRLMKSEESTTAPIQRFDANTTRCDKRQCQKSWEKAAGPGKVKKKHNATHEQHTKSKDFSSPVQSGHDSCYEDYQLCLAKRRAQKEFGHISKHADVQSHKAGPGRQKVSKSSTGAQHHYKNSRGVEAHPNNKVNKGNAGKDRSFLGKCVCILKYLERHKQPYSGDHRKSVGISSEIDRDAGVHADIKYKEVPLHYKSSHAAQPPPQYPQQPPQYHGPQVPYQRPRDASLPRPYETSEGVVNSSSIRVNSSFSFNIEFARGDDHQYHPYETHPDKSHHYDLHPRHGEPDHHYKTKQVGGKPISPHHGGPTYYKHQSTQGRHADPLYYSHKGTGSHMKDQPAYYTHKGTHSMMADEPAYYGHKAVGTTERERPSYYAHRGAGTTHPERPTYYASKGVRVNYPEKPHYYTNRGVRADYPPKHYYANRSTGPMEYGRPYVGKAVGTDFYNDPLIMGSKATHADFPERRCYYTCKGVGRDHQEHIKRRSQGSQPMMEHRPGHRPPTTATRTHSEHPDHGDHMQATGQGRQTGVRLDSKFSFDIAVYKGNKGLGKPAHGPHMPHPYKAHPSRPHLQPHEQAAHRPQHSPHKVNKGTGQMLKRCFCTLKLNNQPTYAVNTMYNETNWFRYNKNKDALDPRSVLRKYINLERDVNVDSLELSGLNKRRLANRKKKDNMYKNKVSFSEAKTKKRREHDFPKDNDTVLLYKARSFKKCKSNTCLVQNCTDKSRLCNTNRKVRVKVKLNESKTSLDFDKKHKSKFKVLGIINKVFHFLSRISSKKNINQKSIPDKKSFQNSLKSAKSHKNPGKTKRKPKKSQSAHMSNSSKFRICKQGREQKKFSCSSCGDVIKKRRVDVVKQRKTRFSERRRKIPLQVYMMLPTRSPYGFSSFCRKCDECLKDIKQHEAPTSCGTCQSCLNKKNRPEVIGDSVSTAKRKKKSAGKEDGGGDPLCCKKCADCQPIKYTGEKCTCTSRKKRPMRGQSDQKGTGNKADKIKGQTATQTIKGSQNMPQKSANTQTGGTKKETKSGKEEKDKKIKSDKTEKETKSDKRRKNEDINTEEDKTKKSVRFSDVLALKDAPKEELLNASTDLVKDKLSSCFERFKEFITIKEEHIKKPEPPPPPPPLFDVHVNTSSKCIMNEKRVMQKVKELGMVRQPSFYELVEHGKACRCCICKKANVPKVGLKLVKAPLVSHPLYGYRGIRHKTATDVLTEQLSGMFYRKKRKTKDQIYEEKKKFKILQKIYEKEDRQRKIERLKCEMKLNKKLVLKHTTDAQLVMECIFDIIRFILLSGFRAIRWIIRCAMRPKHTFHDFKMFIKPDRLSKNIKNFIYDTGIGPLFGRVKVRIKHTECYHNAEKTKCGLCIIAICNPKRMAAIRKRNRHLRDIEGMHKFKCNALMLTLRKHPCKWIYNRWPSLYPHFISLLTIFRQFRDLVLFTLAMLFWSPLILLVELCKASMCCLMCTA